MLPFVVVEGDFAKCVYKTFPEALTSGNVDGNVFSLPIEADRPFNAVVLVGVDVQVDLDELDVLHVFPAVLFSKWEIERRPGSLESS